MGSPVVTINEMMKEKKRIKTRRGLGYVVKARVGDMEENTREGRSMSTRKEVLVCVQDVVRKKRFLVQFEDGQNKYMSFCLLVFNV